MSAFDVEKGEQNPGGMPQSPVLAATARPDGEFLPAYEQAVNTHFRNFDRLECYAGKVQYERAQQANKRKSIWKRCLIFGLLVLLILVAAVGAGLAVFHYQEHSAGSNSPSSITITKRHTITITETLTFSASIPPAIAQAASSFYEEWSSSIAEEMSIDSEHLTPTFTTSIPLPSINMSPTSSTLGPPTTTSIPLPSINMSPTISSALHPPTTTSSTTTSSAPIAAVDPLGDGFCGLPGTFCAGGKRDITPVRGHAKGDGFCGLPGTPCLGRRDSSGIEIERRDKQEDGGRASPALTTVTKHLTILTTSTTSTTAPIPASMIAAAHAYYQHWSSTFFSSASRSLQAATSSTSASTTPSLSR